MQKNIVLRQMMKKENRDLFKKERVRLILPFRYIRYYGCAVLINLPMRSIKINFQKRLFPLDHDKADMDTVSKIINTLDMIMVRH